MLEINANENATIDVLNSEFALGQRDTVTVHVLDRLIAERINIVGTGTCDKTNNLYTYGEFNNLNNVILNLEQDAEVNIVSGIDKNYSTCLHCKSTTDAGLGIVMLPADLHDSIEIGETYILSLLVNVVEGKVKIKAQSEGHIAIPEFEVEKSTDITKTWVQITKEFVAEKSDVNAFNLYLNTDGISEFYIDNLMLFKSTDEIKEAKYGIDAEIIIENPIQQQYKIDKVINWNKNEDGTVDIILYFPPITYVDYQDNILCKLSIYQHAYRRVVTLGNTVYNAIKHLIYNSESFVLNGYVLPSTQFDDVTVNLIVDKV